MRCSTCRLYVPPEDHQCYMQPVKRSSKEDDDDTGLLDADDDNDSSESAYNQLLFFDFECRQENETHEPNLCIVHNEAGDEWVFQGDKTRDEFCEWLFTNEHANCIVMAHNFQGYDGYFIQKYLHKNGIVPEVITRGAKILTLEVPVFNMKFIDSLNFLPMPLAAFPKTFGLNELAKGYFPHFFNKKENEHYIGPILPSSYNNPDGMSPDGEKAFMTWHNNLKENNYVITNIDPFDQCLTIASACNLVYRTNFLKEDTIAIIPPHGYHPKDKHSILALKWLPYYSEKNEAYIQHARNAGEKRVDKYLLDGYDLETSTAYEIHGCFWHGCLKCYARDTVNPVNGKSMHDLHQATVEKVNYLENKGYTVVQEWECDIKRELGRNEEMKRYFDHYEVIDPLQPRDAFFGGRTNAAQLFHKCEEDEKIRYLDYTSLYPFCNAMMRTVVGHPRIIRENFDQDVSNYFGLIKCTVLPPRGLFHPVLSYRTQDKLMFPLCKTCADTCQQTPCAHTDDERAIRGTWCHVELQKALEKGYRILQLHEVWHWSETSDELFKDYIYTFLKIKQEASGYPKECVTEEQKQRYVAEYLEHQGIQLDPGKIEYNPGLRALAKLMLNSFWGKFAQRTNMTKTELIKDPQVYYDYLSSDEMPRILGPTSSSPPLRPLKLYDLLDMLQERALYYDTDSVIFVSKPDALEPSLGPYLSELTDELKGEHITTFISYQYEQDRDKDTRNYPGLYGKAKNKF
ncbi:uncharacterized protein LOC114528308 [Dendronephthya gigantea]|uniref:uncharacterized protein LOC114528308 n=1 Tax=Dendronephthya gigantea TaxID=151771 RepID=UPI0010699850|nr:uncharacterized protein LOC114528308 [Dendronephthya gigantea]